MLPAISRRPARPAAASRSQHMGSLSYAWQRKIAGFIAENTGYRLQLRDYQAH